MAIRETASRRARTARLLVRFRELFLLDQPSSALEELVDLESKLAAIAQRDDDTGIRARLNLAHYQFVSGDYDRATSLLDSVLATRVEDCDSVYYSAHLLRAHLPIDSARAEFEHYLKAARIAASRFEFRVALEGIAELCRNQDFAPLSDPPVAVVPHISGIDIRVSTERSRLAFDAPIYEARDTSGTPIVWLIEDRRMYERRLAIWGHAPYIVSIYPSSVAQNETSLYIGGGVELGSSPPTEPPSHPGDPRGREFSGARHGLKENHENFEGCVSAIYEAAITHDTWRTVATHVSSACGLAAVGIHMRIDASDRSNLEFTSGFTAQQNELAEDVWPAIQAIRPGEFEFLPLEVLDVGTLPGSLQRIVLHESPPLAATISEDARISMDVVVLPRTRALDQSDRRLLNRLIPHFARSLKIAAARDSAIMREQEISREVLDRIPTGIVLVDENGRVVIMNESARFTMSSGEGLRISEGRPVADDPEENLWLQNAIDRARDPEARAEVDPELPPGALRQKGGIFVTPLTAGVSGSTPPDSAALILLGNPRLADVTAINLLSSVYNLTRWEAELTWLLVAGHSLDEAARLRNVTPNTARSQLKSVFTKTGVKRQSELVRIILSGLDALRRVP